MVKTSTILLLFSFFFLLFNGTAIGFILYQVKLGMFFGITLFCSTGFVGALLAAIAAEINSSYYSRLFMYSHLVITLLPLYYYGISILLS